MIDWTSLPRFTDVNGLLAEFGLAQQCDQIEAVSAVKVADVPTRGTTEIEIDVEADGAWNEAKTSPASVQCDVIGHLEDQALKQLQVAYFNRDYWIGGAPPKLRWHFVAGVHPAVKARLAALRIEDESGRPVAGHRIEVVGDLVTEAADEAVVATLRQGAGGVAAERWYAPRIGGVGADDLLAAVLPADVTATHQLSALNELLYVHRELGRDSRVRIPTAAVVRLLAALGFARRELARYAAAQWTDTTPLGVARRILARGERARLALLSVTPRGGGDNGLDEFTGDSHHLTVTVRDRQLLVHELVPVGVGVGDGRVLRSVEYFGDDALDRLTELQDRNVTASALVYDGAAMESAEPDDSGVPSSDGLADPAARRMADNGAAAQSTLHGPTMQELAEQPVAAGGPTLTTPASLHRHSTGHGDDEDGGDPGATPATRAPPGPGDADSSGAATPPEAGSESACESAPTDVPGPATNEPVLRDGELRIGGAKRKPQPSTPTGGSQRPGLGEGVLHLADASFRGAEDEAEIVATRGETVSEDPAGGGAGHAAADRGVAELRQLVLRAGAGDDVAAAGWENTGLQLGTHGAQVWRDPSTGDSWLVKKAPSFGPFLPDLDVAVNRIVAASGVEAPETFRIEIEGTAASAQYMYPGAQDAFPDKWRFDPGELSDEDLLTLQKHHAVDWLLSNHDSHPGQFIRTQDGQLVGIDKRQSYKYFGQDRLDWEFHPNDAYGEVEPIYNTLYRTMAQGGRVLLDPRIGELGQYIRRLQGLDDEEFATMLRPYAQAAARAGGLTKSWDHPGLSPQILTPNDVEGFLRAAIARKDDLAADMGELYDTAAIQATRLHDPSPRHEASDERLPDLTSINNEFRVLGVADVLPERFDEWASLVSMAFPGITPDHVKTIYDYTDYQYMHINPYLRDSEPLSDDMQGWNRAIAHIDDVLENLPPYRADSSDVEATTYRGIAATDSLLAQMQVGETFQDPAYLSTTTDVNKASKFPFSTPDPGVTRILITVVGRSGVEISSLSNLVDEREVLFPRSTEFEIMSREWNAVENRLAIVMREKTAEMGDEQLATAPRPDAEAPAQAGHLDDRATDPQIAAVGVAGAPDPSQLHLLAHQPEVLGTHGAQLYADLGGQQWLVKTPQPGDEFMVPLDVATSHLQQHMNLPCAETYAVPFNGELSTLVKWLPHAEQAWEYPPHLNDVAPQDLLTLQKHQALDWLIANHDAHVGNWVRTQEGDLVGIDKGQAFKYFGRDRLDDNFYHNYYAREPIYNSLWREYSLGAPGQMLDPRKGELGQFVQGLQDLPDEQLRSMFHPYATAAADAGLLATGAMKGLPVDPTRGLSAPMIRENDPEAFLDALVARKNKLGNDLAALYDKASAERACRQAAVDINIPPPVSPRHEVSDERLPDPHIDQHDVEDFVQADIDRTTVDVSIPDHQAADLSPSHQAPAEPLPDLMAIRNEFGDRLDRYSDRDLPSAGSFDEFARRVSKAYPEITVKHVDTIHNYTANDYEKINSYVRNRDPLSPSENHFLQGLRSLMQKPFLKAAIARIDHALASLPPYRADPSDTESTTYRGVAATDSLLAQMQVGSTFRDPGYLSTTMAMEVTADYTYNYRLSESYTEVLITVIGRSGVDVSPLALNIAAKEVLFPRGTEFEIISREWGPNNQRPLGDEILHITMREKTAEMGGEELTRAWRPDAEAPIQAVVEEIGVIKAHRDDSGPGPGEQVSHEGGGHSGAGHNTPDPGTDSGGAGDYHRGDGGHRGGAGGESGGGGRDGDRSGAPGDDEMGDGRHEPEPAAHEGHGLPDLMAIRHELESRDGLASEAGFDE